MLLYTMLYFYTQCYTFIHNAILLYIMLYFSTQCYTFVHNAVHRYIMSTKSGKDVTWWNRMTHTRTKWHPMTPSDVQRPMKTCTDVEWHTDVSYGTYWRRPTMYWISLLFGKLDRSWRTMVYKGTQRIHELLLIYLHVDIVKNAILWREKNPILQQGFCFIYTQMLCVFNHFEYIHLWIFVFKCALDCCIFVSLIRPICK